MIKTLYLLLSMCFFFLLNLQQLKSQTLIHGTIKDANDKVLQFANVLLLKSYDSGLVKGIMSDASGKFSFENVKSGSYLVTATFAGMKQVFTPIVEVNADKKELNAGILYLRNVDVQLKNVTVAVKIPVSYTHLT